MGGAALAVVLDDDDFGSSDEYKEGFIIEGVREDGAVFRPSDWVDRLATLAATFGADRRLRYSLWVQPTMVEGKRCLAVGRELEQHQPEIYRHILQFARDNQLRMQPRRPQRSEPVSLVRLSR